VQVLDDIWSSIKGSAKTRITDPVIGVFIFSWILCNWDRVAILLWGNDDLENRVKHISEEMAFIDKPELIFQNYDLLILPLILSLLYIFTLPILSFWVTRIVNPTELKRHEQTIDLHINKEKKQKSLNKVRLRADPDNKFLEKEIEIDLALEKSNAERVEQENLAAKEKAEEAKASKEREVQERNNAASIAEETKAKADSAKLELKKKERIENNEILQLKVSTAEHKATMASHRFPSVYLFLNDISESIKADGVVMSLDGLSSCVAAIFGYDNFKKLVDDKNFTNENLKKLKFVICDPDYLTEKFTQILEDEDVDNYDSEWLIGHVEMVFDELPYHLN